MSLYGNRSRPILRIFCFLSLAGCLGAARPAAAEDLLLRVACFAGSREALGLPQSGELLSHGDLTGYLADWRPESDNDEVKGLFALHDVVEIARIARRLPETGGVALAVISVHEQPWTLRFEVTPKAENAVAAIEVWRGEELLFAPQIRSKLGERAMVSGTGLPGIPFLWLAVEVSKVSEEAPTVAGSSKKPEALTVDGEEVLPPRRIESPPISYTEKARAARVEGVVILQVEIDERGRVDAVRVLRGLPMGLSEAAAEGVRHWRFEPATRAGEPVRVRYNITVRFSLGEDPKEGRLEGR